MYFHFILAFIAYSREIMQVDISLFTIDDDIPPCGLESQANSDSMQQPSQNLSLLSVDDILGSVSSCH